MVIKTLRDIEDEREYELKPLKQKVKHKKKETKMNQDNKKKKDWRKIFDFLGNVLGLGVIVLMFLGIASLIKWFINYLF